MSDSGDLPKPPISDLGINTPPIPAINEVDIKSFLEVIVDRLILYHGSGITGIKEFRAADETTIGMGVYMTSQLEAGKGYARRRANRSPDAKPTVYEVEINNVRLADLRQPEALPIFARLLKTKLEISLKNPNVRSNQHDAIVETLGIIRRDEYRSLKDLTWNHQELTTDIIKTQGYDGLIAEEGGEGRGEDKIGIHDTYLIFDPAKVTVLREM
jgi:hypothetical protein